MEITENKIFEAFGLETSEKNQETAEPEQAAEQEPAEVEGANEQEPAEPAQADTEEESESGDDDGTADQTSGQTEEERRANAKRRREQERQQEIADAVQKALQQERQRNNQAMESFFKDAGLTNSITGKPITNMREFAEWKTAYDDAKLKSDLKSGKLTQEDLNRMVADSPVVKQANAIIQKQRQEQVQGKIEEQLREIHEMDPSINSVEDLTKMDNYQDFYDLVKTSNMTFVQAYKILNFDKLTSSRATAAKQAALNNQRGKNHLTGTAASRGSGSRSVPQDEMAMFRVFNPGATEQQILDYYNKQKG